MAKSHALAGRPLGVFTEGWPGLATDNLHLLTEETGVIDWHAPFDLTDARKKLVELVKTVLIPRNLKLDSVVFGLDGESYADPATARDTVGFAAPGADRRARRFQYTSTLVAMVAEHVPSSHFVRNRVTLKGHFGAFDKRRSTEYKHLLACLKNLRDRVLTQHNALILSETGCEPASEVIELLQQVGTDFFGANWDTANLQLWGVDFDTFEYARELAKAKVLRGVHVKAGQAPTRPGEWGIEIDPTPEFLSRVFDVLKECPSFDGSPVVEREKFLGDQRESQAEKAAGISATLKLIRQILAA